MTTTRNILIGLSVLVLGALAFALATNLQSVGATTRSVAFDLGDAHRASVKLMPDVANLSIREGRAGTPMLLEGTIALRGNERLVERVEGESILDLALQTHSGPGVHFGVTGPTWDLALTPDTPLDLVVHSEVGRLDLDLRNTRVETLHVRTETGRSNVYLPAGDSTGTISTEVGDVVLHVPRNANATISVGRMMSAVRADAAFDRSGGTYRLNGTGPDIDVRVTNSMGLIRLETY